MAKRIQYFEANGKLTVINPLKRPWLIFVLATPIVVAWNIFSIIAGMNGNFPQGPDFYYKWWGMLILFDLVFIYNVLFFGFAKETIHADLDSIMLRFDVLGIGKSRYYPVREISNLRVSGFIKPTFFIPFVTPISEVLGAKLAFEHGGKTRRFGIHLTAEGAEQLLEKIKHVQCAYASDTKKAATEEAVSRASKRFSYHREGDALIIRIKVIRRWYALVFMTGWLILWLAFGLNLLFSFTKEEFRAEFLENADQPFFFAFMIAVICGFFLLWIWALAILPYFGFAIAFGKELIVLSPKALVLKFDILGRGRQQVFDLNKVKNLRPYGPLFKRGNALFPFNKPYGTVFGGTVAFDYEGEKTLFGNELGEEEAREVIEVIRAYAGKSLI